MKIVYAIALAIFLGGCAEFRDDLKDFRAKYSARIEAQCSGDLTDLRAEACETLRVKIEMLQSATDAEIDALEKELIEALNAGTQ